MLGRTTLALAMAACVWASALWAAAQPQPPGAATTDYQRQVHTILAAQCLGCHSAERRSGGLSLASYADALEGGRSGAAIRPGDAAGSLLVGRITGRFRRRCRSGSQPLSAGEIATIRGGSTRARGQTPLRRRRRRSGKPRSRSSVRRSRRLSGPGWTTPVDRLVAAYLQRHGGPHPELVGDAAFARRAYLDIWGLLPPSGRSRRSSRIEPRTSGAAGRRGCSPTTRSTPSTGSRSGTTCCATTKASTTTPDGGPQEHHATGCCPRSNPTCRTTNSSTSC